MLNEQQATDLEELDITDELLEFMRSRHGGLLAELLDRVLDDLDEASRVAVEFDEAHADAAGRFELGDLPAGTPQ